MLLHSRQKSQDPKNVFRLLYCAIFGRKHWLSGAAAGWAPQDPQTLHPRLIIIVTQTTVSTGAEGSSTVRGLGSALLPFCPGVVGPAAHSLYVDCLGNTEYRPQKAA